MKQRHLKDTLIKLLTQAVNEHVFPGAVAGISSGPPTARTTIILPFGATTYPSITPSKGSKPYPMAEDVFFDLASLTKPLATTLAVLSLIQRQKIQLTDKLPELLRGNISGPLQQSNLAQLLSHCSGLPSHKPYFERLRDLPKKQRMANLKQWLLSEKLIAPPGQSTCYSDLGYIILGWIVEHQSGLDLDIFVKEKILNDLSLNDHIFFNPANQPGPQKYAPTELCPWRKKLMLGQVHDDNCYTMGGVAGHAGLFGDIYGVLTLATHLLDVWQGKASHPNYRSTDLKKFTATIPHTETSWRLGFDSPSPLGSSAGQYLSPQSFGHLGFTGTSFWIDPSLNLVMVLLSNRVNPSRENILIREFRPKFHNSIVQALQTKEKK